MRTLTSYKKKVSIPNKPSKENNKAKKHYIKNEAS